MPSIKEKCVCQICICGRHHCGEEIKFPTLIEESESEEQVVDPAAAASSGPGNEPDNGHEHRAQGLSNTTTSRTQGPRAGTQKQTSSSSTAQLPNGQKVYFKVEKKIIKNYDSDVEFEEEDDDGEMSEESDNNVPNGTSPRSQRKQWQKSPNEVEQLTRSLSRLRTDLDTGLHYEKFIEKEQNSKAGHKSKSKAVTYNHPTYLPSTTGGPASNDNHKYLASRMSHLKKDSSTESFLPPLTGFSDSDSSFGSFSCFGGEGECKNQMHCICETLKNCNINGDNKEAINYIDSDQWIVTKPQRMRPKDNLRLDGPMDLNTTFRSTYDEKARRIAPSDSDESKRSSRASNPGSLYLGTRMGRTGHTPVLRSARRRRARNRPQTSLKLGGDGYYHTINQDSYKNFVIVDGQAKMINGHLPGGGGSQAGEKQLVKLPRMVKKQRSIKNLKLRGKGTEEERKIIRVGDGEEIEKVEKKSLRIVNNDLSGESDVEKMKMVMVKKRPSKHHDKEDAGAEESKPEVSQKDAQTDSDDLPVEKTSEQVKGQDNWTIDNASSSMRKQFASHRYQDHIKEMGLLERNENAPPESQNPDARKHTRKLHETSTRIILPDTATPPPPPKVTPKSARDEGSVTVAPPRKMKTPPKVKTPPKEKLVDGHVVDKSHPKPFIIPERIHRHKNASSVNLFNGNEMDFVTTNRQAFGGGRANGNRIPSAKRRIPTAGKRVLRSARRRNLFRQSSDSMFSSMDPANFIKKRPSVEGGVTNGAGDGSATVAGEKTPTKSVYNQTYGDHLYCPALDVTNSKSNDSFKFTGEAGGHKYYLSTQYDK